MGEATTKPYRILYRKTPAWLVGEEDTNAVVRRNFPDVSLTVEHYPGDYGGIVISVIPVAKYFHAGDLAGDGRAQVVLDLTPEQHIQLQARQAKIINYKIEVATFNDRWGATAAGLRAAFADADDMDLQDCESDEVRRFNKEAARLQRELAKTISHTGVGLYEVGPGKLYLTIQSALAQLWADQGGSNFDATQEIRIYDDTYTEIVALNASLRPTGDYRLKLNAASENDSVILTNSGLASSALDLNLVDNVRLVNLEIQGVLSGANYALRDIGANTVIKYCTFDGQGTATYGILGGSAARFVECTFTDCVGALVRQAYESEFIQCVFRDGKVETLYGTAQFEACDFDGAYIRYYSTLVTAPPPGALLRVEGCTFYNAFNAFQFSGTAGYVGTRIRVRNCVFQTITTVFNGPTSSLHRIISDHNCFYNYTHIAQIDGTDYDSLAAWQVFTDEEGESPDANSIEADPLLTNPGAGDFSLQAGSPCRRRGAGVSVLYDVLGTKLDPYHPDIGSVASRPSIITTDLHGRWLDRSTSLFRIGRDHGPDGYDMENVGGVALDPRVGGMFDGTNYLSHKVADWRNGDSAGTICAWVKQNAIAGSQFIFASADDSANHLNYIGLYGEGGFLKVRQRSVTTSDIVRSTDAVLTAGVWVHVVVVSNGVVYTLYVNGVAVAITVQAGTNSGDWLADTANRESITIGCRVANSIAVELFNGAIRDSRYYSRALSENEIKSIVAKGVPDITPWNRVMAAALR